MEPSSVQSAIVLSAGGSSVTLLSATSVCPGFEMKPTKRNHYNPCFWTAVWNSAYYDAFINGSRGDLIPREQIVNALNVKSNKILVAKVDNVHFDKNLGVAEITSEGAKQFCKRHHPDKYESFCRESNEDEYPVYIDFEEILTHLEKMIPYRVLLDIIRRQDLANGHEKVFLASFVYLQLLRSHAIMNSMLEWNSELGIKKFEYFIMLKWGLSDSDFLYQAVAPLVFSRWTLYRTNVDTFPLCDSPVLVRPQSIMIAISPRLLLEISTSIPAEGDEWYVKDSVKNSKLVEFRRRTIGNTFREIIFDDKSMLEYWQGTREFRQRVETVQEMVSYNALVTREKNRELWLINALGNR